MFDIVQILQPLFIVKIVAIIFVIMVLIFTIITAKEVLDIDDTIHLGLPSNIVKAIAYLNIIIVF